MGGDIGLDVLLGELPPGLRLNDLCWCSWWTEAGERADEPEALTLTDSDGVEPF